MKGQDVRGREMEKWSASKEDSQKAHLDGELGVDAEDVTCLEANNSLVIST